MRNLNYFAFLQKCKKIGSFRSRILAIAIFFTLYVAIRAMCLLKRFFAGLPCSYPYHVFEGVDEYLSVSYISGQLGDSTGCPQ